MRRYAFVEQHSEEGCGAACVATVEHHYGKKVSMALVRPLVGTGHRGTALPGLRRASMSSASTAGPCAPMWW
jgi:ABC-type bacteriocin/lantibiotic exporter with double-glycine peptidase domain